MFDGIFSYLGRATGVAQRHFAESSKDVLNENKILIEMYFQKQICSKNSESK